MSAPRKIWLQEPVGLPGEEERSWCVEPQSDVDDLYHHDDVVRELMEYVGHKRNCALMRAFIDGKVCTCGFDAALAKIGQEDQR